MTIVTFVFGCFAAWAVVSALLCITRSNAIASALWLVSTMFSLAAIFVLLQAQFIAAIQVLVYAGAVMVLFLFVIMLLNLEQMPVQWKRWPVWAVAAGLTVVLGVTLFSLRSYTPERMSREFSPPEMQNVNPVVAFPEGHMMNLATAEHGAVGGIAQPLFQTYLIPFEITSVLLLAAVIGAVVLAKRKL